MKNKLILFVLFFALLLATSTKGADPDEGSLTIYVDAGKDIDSFLSFAKTIEGKQSLIDDALKSLSSEIKALKERMTAEAKASEERWNQRMPAELTRLNPKEVELSNQLAKSTDVATPHKRPAELACEKITNDLRSIGETTFNDIAYYSLRLYTSNILAGLCSGNLIDKRFLLIAAECVSTGSFTKVSWDNSTSIKIKAIHIHPDFSSKTPSLNNIALIELESDVAYNSDWYPVCLYASEVIPESDLMGAYGKVQIVTDAECFNKTGTHLKPS
ncbi:serine protease persephone-like isoform X6 [Zeugodacus cucurbitae]|uniref:serine protease persephone-like isoform X6 n=1 Tax=Zeugodacus cucurbitae TaxID=28588 RepID=UPI0023D9262B|nr:serine protease persephone-like isoform X6 [Zeugodacus cucurbitae]